MVFNWAAVTRLGTSRIGRPIYFPFVPGGMEASSSLAVRTHVITSFRFLGHEWDGGEE